MTIEQSYEVAHALDERDHDELLDDLLLHPVFHTDIAEERRAFRLKQVIDRDSE